MTKRAQPTQRARLSLGIAFPIRSAVFRGMGLVVCLAFAQPAKASDIEFVIGDYMEQEDGDWDANTGPLKNPFGVDFDSKGQMYVVELGGGRVHRIDSGGEIKTIAGDGSKSYTGDRGPALNATFNGMHNCAMTRDDRLLISDSWNHCVRVIDLESGIIDTLIGMGKEGFSGDQGPANEASFNYVMCITLNPAKRRLQIADLKNRRIREVDLVSSTVTTIAGNGKKGVPIDGNDASQSPLVDPRAVAADRQGNTYILERGGHALRVVDRHGKIRTVAGTGKKGWKDGPALEATFAAPKHLCVDDLDRVYIADDQNAAIRRYDPSMGTVETILGRGVGDPRIRLSHPHGVCVHGGDLYVVDSGNHRVLRMPHP